MVDAKRRYHMEKVEVVADCGHEKETVYRYMRTCRRCDWFAPGGPRGRGHCDLYDKPIHGGATSCPEFDPTEETLTEMWCETEARDGRMCKVTYKGIHYYLERSVFVRALGYDPDEKI